MAKRRKDLSDDEILRLARMRITETASSTFTEKELTTQLSVERGVIWLIHFIEFHFEDPSVLTEVGANTFEDLTAQVTRESKTAILNFDDSDLVQGCNLRMGRSAAIGTDAGPIVNSYQGPIVFDYIVPMPYAAQSIFGGLLGTDASIIHDVNIRIGYTIKEVSDKFFFRVAQALVG